MKGFAAGMLLLLATAPASFAKDKTADEEPIAWGMLSQNAGCVIFREYRKTSGMYWGVAVTTRSVSMLEVIEAQHATLEQTKIPETQDAMNALQRTAMQENLKYVKIPAKYTPEQLEKARGMCGNSTAGNKE